jgi:hypothetical protein
MELISYYIEHIQKPYPVDYYNSRDMLREPYQEIDDRWRSFHEAKDPMIVYICGRRTGKTHNILQRIVMSDELNIMVITMQPNVLFSRLYDMCVNPIEREIINGGYRIRLDKKTIYLLRPTANVRGFSYIDAVYFDEPEFYDFNFRRIRKEIRYDREIAVGSLINNQGNTEFQRLFRGASHSRIIDSFDEGNDVEFRPSLAVDWRM